MLSGPRSFSPNSGLAQPIKFDIEGHLSFSELQDPSTSDFLGGFASLEESLQDSFHKIYFMQDEEPFQLLV
jgi:hypothetical protein